MAEVYEFKELSGHKIHFVHKVHEPLEGELATI